MKKKLLKIKEPKRVKIRIMLHTMRLGVNIKTGTYLGRDTEKLGIHLRACSQFFISVISKTSISYRNLYDIEVLDITENGGLLHKSLFSKILNFKESCLNNSEIPVIILVDYFDVKNATNFPKELIYINSIENNGLPLWERFSTKDLKPLLYAIKRLNLLGFCYFPFGSKLENIENLRNTENLENFLKYLKNLVIDQKELKS